ncbi:MAG: hypothetical protein ABR591_08850 [Candidatus Velthaea sp.]
MHLFLTAGATTRTAALARVRAGRALPHAGTVFVLAAVYYGIESLEGNGIELNTTQWAPGRRINARVTVPF